jgi:hypothetical protein
MKLGLVLCLCYVNIINVLIINFIGKQWYDLLSSLGTSIKVGRLLKKDIL